MIPLKIHTMTPWHHGWIEDIPGERFILIRGQSESVLRMYWPRDEVGAEVEANAVFIVLAVNSHADLLAALESIENDDGHIPKAIWDMRCAAIKKAKGEA